MKTKRGFSLIQVMIAIAILGIAVIPVTMIFTSSASNVSKSGAILEAIIVAQSLLDQVSNENFLIYQTGQEFLVPSKKFAHLKVNDHFQKKFKGSAKVRIESINDGLTNGNLRMITITVYWEEMGRQLSSTLSTYKAMYGDILLN